MASKSPATKAVKAQRIDKIIELLQSGKYRWEIVNELTNEWNCTERNVEKYMTAAYKLLKINYDKDILENILTKYDSLYKKAIGQGDNKLAVRILDSISRINGLNKIDITTNGKDMTPTIINIIKPNE